jgi:hypothetical protein
MYNVDQPIRHKEKKNTQIIEATDITEHIDHLNIYMRLVR